ncbi:MAG: phage holin family protein [Patescibacteria group bacterium]
MRAIIRNIVFHSVSLFALTQFLSGFKITGGFATFLFAGAVLSVMLMVVKPILNIISLPLNILTLGLFSFFSNIIIFLLLTMFVPQISIVPFTFQGFSYSGFMIPSFHFNQITAFIVSGFALSAIITFLTWLIRK